MIGNRGEQAINKLRPPTPVDDLESEVHLIDCRHKAVATPPKVLKLDFVHKTTQAEADGAQAV
jgi:hypothetical protein